jgi:EpsI family protein
MTTFRLALKLPTISLVKSIALFACFVCASLLTIWATPNITGIRNAPDLEATTPLQFGDWKAQTSPFAQVRLATGDDAGGNEPYDQVVTRTYVNGRGQQVMLALAWGERQRQEVKVHRPDLCYVAQGYKVVQLTPANFPALQSIAGRVTGKHMVAMERRGGEAVAYWIRIGSLYSENAFETRTYILKEGLAGRVPDGILVRASVRIQTESEAATAFPILEQFLTEFVAASPPNARALLTRS